MSHATVLIISDSKPTDEIIRAMMEPFNDAKWGRWQVGGRWSGMLQVKPGAEAIRGKSGVMDSKYSDHGVDICQIGSLDLAAMKAEGENRRARWFESCQNKAGLTREEMRQACNEYEPTHIAWLELQDRPRGEEYYAWLAGRGQHILAKASKACFEFPSFPGSIEDWIKTAPAFSTFAVLKDGKWYERGEMGWWGAVANEKKGDDWEAEFNNLLNGLNPETWIAVVDYHI